MSKCRWLHIACVFGCLIPLPHVCGCGDRKAPDERVSRHMTGPPDIVTSGGSEPHVVAEVGSKGAVRESVHLYPAYVDGKYGYIDATGRLVIKPQFESAAPFSEGLGRVSMNGRAGFVDERGVFQIGPRFLRADDFHGGLARVSEQRGKWKFVDAKGVSPFARTFAYPPGRYSEGQAAVRVGQRWGVIDESGDFVVEPKYDDVGRLSQGRRRFKVNGKWGFIDQAGRVMVPAQFVDAGDFTEGLARVAVDSETADGKQARRWGYIDRKGNVAIPAQFSHASEFWSGRAPVVLNGTHAYITTSGEKAFDLLLDTVDIYPYSNGLASVGVKVQTAENGDDRELWGFINTEGRLSIQPRFLHALPFNGPLARVLISTVATGPASVENVLGYVNTKGMVVWEEKQGF